eukprot:2164811-Rhodomonas_salina.1
MWIALTRSRSSACPRIRHPIRQNRHKRRPGVCMNVSEGLINVIEGLINVGLRPSVSECPRACQQMHHKRWHSRLKRG